MDVLPVANKGGMGWSVLANSDGKPADPEASISSSWPPFLMKETSDFKEIFVSRWGIRRPILRRL